MASSAPNAPLATQVDGEGQYKLLLDLAVMELKQKRYQQAEPILQKLRKLNRADIQVYRMLAQAYEGQQKQHLALLAWQQINQFDEHTIDDEAEYARLALVEDQYQIAEHIYQQWLNSEEINHRLSALNNLGFSRLLQKDFSQAREYFQRALKIDPLNSKALNNLILVDALTGR
jgi:Tfp pilus assembly protein PilF